ncbi:MAG: hypothetical protein AAGJ35_08040, partial [Myxococcota bacterium]
MNAYILLVSALLLLGSGPFLSWICRRFPSFMCVLDTFVLVSVGAFVVFHMLPDSWTHMGVWSLVLACSSLLTVGLFQRVFSKTKVKFRRVTLVLAVLGLSLHAIMDGLGLGIPSTHMHGTHIHSTNAMGLAILMHRLPMGLAIWVWAEASEGRRFAIGTLLLMGAATVFGFMWGSSLETVLEGNGVAAFQALLGGVLLHILWHREVRYPASHKPRWKWGEMWGLGLGLLCVFWFTVGENA